MRILYFGTYDKEYGRNRIMIDGLRANGVEVTECHVALWSGTQDKLAHASGAWRSPAFLWRLIRSYLALLRKYWPTRNRYDVMVLGYTGQIDALIARPLTWLARRPLALDLYMSLYLILVQRNMADRHRLAGRLVKAVEWLACRLPDRLIIDTPEYRQFFSDTYSVTQDRFRLVPAGADDQIFKPTPSRPPDGLFRVAFAGTFIPQGHGVDLILRAAQMLQDDPTIAFEFIGEGQELPAAKELARSLGLSNVTFTGWVPRHELPGRLAQADVLLGVFGTTYHVLWTVPNKIYEGLALARPVVTRDAPAVRRTLRDREEVYLVEAGSYEALAYAIQDLQAHPELCARLAHQGSAKVQANHSIAALGREMAGVLQELLQARQPSRPQHPA